LKLNMIKKILDNIQVRESQSQDLRRGKKRAKN